MIWPKKHLDRWSCFRLDKGTFDAIALADKVKDGHAPIDGYPARVSRLLKHGAYFLITCKVLALQPCLLA